jgi:D-3-phosphoglycerate dehydrogenase / 2-oxoglutarate reductase
VSLRVLVSCPQMQEALPAHAARLQELGVELVVPDVVQALSEENLLAVMPDIDGVVAGDDEFTAAVLDASPRLRILSKWGVGTDGIDRDAATRLGIPVTNTPGVFADEVADVVLGYLVLLARGLHRIDRAVRAGSWLKIQGETLRGRTAGVVGLGSTGLATSRRAAAVGMDVVGVDPSPEATARAAAGGVRPLPMADVLGAADYLVLCAPLTPATHHLLDAERIALLPRGARVVNVARGPLVDEPALVAALRSGQLAGAALDVFEHEPLSPASPLAAMDNVVLGSHNASNTRQAVERASRVAVDNLLRHLFVPRAGGRG